MLADVFNQLVLLLTNLFGGSSLGDLALFWINGISVVATIAVAIAPLYIIVRIMRWFIGD